MQPSKAYETTGHRTRRIVLTLSALLLAGPASAQSTADWGYEVGLRTTFMISELRLSELGGGFADLSPGGDAVPHASSFFVLWPLGAHTRLGIETLVGNSYADSDTEMLFQETGVTAEYQTAGTWFAAVSVQVGGMIASATQSSDRDPLRVGVHYKESGYFLAPQVGVGRRVGRFDLRAIGKPVWHFGAEGLDAFDSFCVGISVARVSG
jgi:hypothetical protein